MCTCLIAGRKVTVSGKAMLAANDDWDGVPGVLTHVPRAVHGKDSYILTGGAAIPQVRETCGYVYTACRYTIGNLDRGWAGGMNDRGVAVAGTGVDAYRPAAWKQEGWLMEPDDIPLLILQRAKSARDAVQTIGELIGRYGLRPSYIEGSAGSSAATFSIADREEGWVLEVYPGRCWLAVRVPDDAVSVRVNAFGTHDADLADPVHTMSSPGLADYARKRGLWDGDERHFDFAAVFGSETSPTEWGPEKDPMNLRRRWRAMYLADGVEETENTLRYLARPAVRKDGEGKLAKEHFMRMLSDVYEGTPYDLTRVPEGGPHHDPFADGLPDYALCRKGTLASFVTEYAGKNEEPLMWTAMGIPRLVPYVPIWVDIEKLPDCCDAGMWQEMNRLCTLVRARYDLFSDEAAKAKEAFQESMNKAIMEEAKAESDGLQMRSVHTDQTAAHIEKAVACVQRTISKTDLCSFTD